MNNNQMNFDPMTGQPINNNPSTPANPIPTTEPVQPVQQPVASVELKSAQINNAYINKQQMQGIATVEQDKQQFIQNTQASDFVKKEEKKEGPNIGFIITLFVVILAAIIFLFPYLMKTLG